MLWPVSRLLRSRLILPPAACARRQAARRTGLAARDQVRRIPGDRPQGMATASACGPVPRRTTATPFTRIRDAVAALPVAIALSCSERLDASERSEQPAKAILSQTIRRVLSGASAKTAPRAPMGAHDKGLFRRVHAHLSNPTSDPITPAHRVPLSAPPGSRVSPRCRKSVTIRES